ncbi:restriction endonuclease [bacterium]|nr:restriction endonuclease [bacterium]
MENVVENIYEPLIHGDMFEREEAKGKFFRLSSFQDTLRILESVTKDVGIRLPEAEGNDLLDKTYECYPKEYVEQFAISAFEGCFDRKRGVVLKQVTRKSMNELKEQVRKCLQGSQNKDEKIACLTAIQNLSSLHNENTISKLWNDYVADDSEDKDVRGTALRIWADMVICTSTQPEQPEFDIHELTQEFPPRYADRYREEIEYLFNNLNEREESFQESAIYALGKLGNIDTYKILDGRRESLKNLEQLIRNALDEICKRPQPIEQNGFTGEDFENAIGTLLSEVGYKKIEGTQKTRDGGIDFFLHHSIPLSGEYRIGVQCKKEKVASRKKPSDFTNFIGALTQHECREGFWMTTAPESKFDDDDLRKSSPPIRLFAKSKIINLLNTHKCTKFRFY